MPDALHFQRASYNSVTNTFTVITGLQAARTMGSSAIGLSLARRYLNVTGNMGDPLQLNRWDAMAATARFFGQNEAVIAKKLGSVRYTLSIPSVDIRNGSDSYGIDVQIGLLHDEVDSIRGVRLRRRVATDTEAPATRGTVAGCFLPDAGLPMHDLDAQRVNDDDLATSSSCLEPRLSSRCLSSWLRGPQMRSWRSI